MKFILPALCLVLSLVVAVHAQADLAVVDSLNQKIAANPANLDYVIQDVCVDSSDKVISGDPAVCALHRNVRIGEKVPYLVTDFDKAHNNVTYQAMFSYPVPGADGNLKIMHLKLDYGNFSSATTVNSWDITRDGYDLMDTTGAYNSFIRTSDGGCYDQRTDGPNGRTGGWILFGTNMQPSSASHAITMTRISPTVPSTCGSYRSTSHSTDALDVWNTPASVTYETGKSLLSIVTYHYANKDLTKANNALERYFFSREYGFTRWEAWQTLDACKKDHTADPERCEPTNSKNFLIGRCGPTAPIPATAVWGGVPWVRLDCRDLTNYIALTSPQIPLFSAASGQSLIAEIDGLKDIDSASVFAANARGPVAIATVTPPSTSVTSLTGTTTPPAGSYTNSCSACSVSGNALACSCKNIKSQVVKTTLNYMSCVGDISNNNGTLTCAGSSASTSTPASSSTLTSTPASCGMKCALPAGSYTLSCSGCYATSTAVNCNCKNTRGRSVATSLLYGNCTSGINNINGALKCDGVK